MKTMRGAQVFASGLCWAAAYNAIWALAWFTFMRGEWQHAFAALGRPMAWTAEVWAVWGVMTVPLGVAVMTHAQSRPRVLRAAVRASIVLMLVFVLGLTAWGVAESLSLRVLALDALVNLIAMPVASLAAAGMLASITPTPAVSVDAAV